MLSRKLYQYILCCFKKSPMSSCMSQGGHTPTPIIALSGTSNLRNPRNISTLTLWLVRPSSLWMALYPDENLWSVQSSWPQSHRSRARPSGKQPCIRGGHSVLHIARLRLAVLNISILLHIHTHLTWSSLEAILLRFCDIQARTTFKNDPFVNDPSLHEDARVLTQSCLSFPCIMRFWRGEYPKLSLLVVAPQNSMEIWSTTKITKETSPQNQWTRFCCHCWAKLPFTLNEWVHLGECYPSPEALRRATALGWSVTASDLNVAICPVPLQALDAFEKSLPIANVPPLRLIWETCHTEAHQIASGQAVIVAVGTSNAAFSAMDSGCCRAPLPGIRYPRLRFEVRYRGLSLPNLMRAACALLMEDHDFLPAVVFEPFSLVSLAQYCIHIRTYETTTWSKFVALRDHVARAIVPRLSGQLAYVSRCFFFPNGVPTVAVWGWQCVESHKFALQLAALQRQPDFL